MMNYFKKEDCAYTKFTLENHKISFADDGEYILISIPFHNETPESIKIKLNDIIYHEMNSYLATVDYMPMPSELLLNARMQIQCFSDENISPHYYITITITDLRPGIGDGIWIDKAVCITPGTSKFFIEFTQYCWNKLDEKLFPSFSKNNK